MKLDPQHEADILASTYFDTCTVYRPFKDCLNNGAKVFKSGTDGQIIHRNIPCGLSSPSGGKLQQTPYEASTPCDYLIFVRPEVDIKPNDTVVVVHYGKIIYTIAGLAKSYYNHCVVPLTLERDRV